MEIDFRSDSSGGDERAQGSDNRLNVSSRSDGRGYYNSRDASESYTLPFSDLNCTTGDVVVYLRNDKSDGKHMVIRSASINSDTAVGFEFVTLTGTAAGGAVNATPVNMNQAGVARTATATAVTVVESDVSPISGLVVGVEIDHLAVVAGGHGEFLFQDQLRLGQDQAIGIVAKSGTAVSAFGTIFFYFE